MRVWAILGVACLPLAIACGSGKPADRRAPTSSAASAPSSVNDITATAEASSPAGSGSGSVFPVLFEHALAGADGGPSAETGAGDPSLKQYLLTAADLPAGFTVAQTSTTTTTDGISSGGTVDVAISTAQRGDPEAGDATLLISMAMHFSDLRDLESQFKDLTADELAAQLKAVPDTAPGLFRDVEPLDTSTLGDHAVGMSLSFDLGKLIEAIGAALGDEFEATPQALPEGFPSALKMRMYFFGRGAYAGGLMQISFGDSQPADDLALAKLIDDRLASAPD